MATSMSASAPTGEIRKIAPDGTQSTLAFLPLHQEVQPCQNSAGSAGITGIALDHQRNVYVGVRSCSAADLGIWKVTPDGQQSLLANLPGDLFPPGARVPTASPTTTAGSMSPTSALALVWRVHCSTARAPRRSGLPTRCCSTRPEPPPGIPGPNGLQVFHNEVYVSVSTRGHVVAFRYQREWVGRPRPRARRCSGSTTSPSTCRGTCTP